MNGTDNIRFNICYGCAKPLKDGQFICAECGYDNSRVQNPDDVLPEGTILNGKFLVGKMLGRGGFGITYVGYDLILNVPVAIKEFFPVGVGVRTFHSIRVTASASLETENGFESGCRAFQDEAQILARFSSPNIVRVRDFFRENGTSYIVMDLIDGNTLTKEILKSGGRIPWQRVVDLFKPLILELGELHKKSLIHRDIKPDNIKVVKNEKTGDDYLVLLDFGAARRFVSENVTKTYTAMVTPGYAPIEQYNQKSRQGPFTDVYAICATMYAAITGERPADSTGRSTGEIELREFSEFGISVPEYVRNAIFHGLAFLGKDRPQSMKELYDELSEEYVPENKSVQKKTGENKSVPEVKKITVESTETNIEKPKKTSAWIFIILFILLSAAGAYIYLFGPSKILPQKPTEVPANTLTAIPTNTPTSVPSKTPTEIPSNTPTSVPSKTPTEVPSNTPTSVPSKTPTETASNTLNPEIHLNKAVIDSVELNDNKLSVKWQKVSGAKYYEVWYSVDDGEYKKLSTTIYSSLSKTLTENSGQISVKVRACVDSDCGDFSLEHSVMPEEMVPSEIPTEEQTATPANADSLRRVVIDTAELNDNKLTVKWQKVSGAKYYEVWYSVDDGDYKKLSTTIYTSLSKTLTENSGQISVKVHACRDSDCGEFSRPLIFSNSEANDAALLDQTIQDASELNRLGWEAYEKGDYSLALSYFQRGADQGDAPGQYSLGELYRDGLGVEQSYETALKYAQMSAEQGYSDAQRMLGDLYREGLGVEQSFEKAAEYYKLSADQGNEWAQYFLGELYRDGLGVERSYPESVKYFQLAADSGISWAQCQMGDFYRDGLGVEQSYETAAMYYESGAEQNNDWCQNALGDLYRRGEGVPQNYMLALNYYRKAADQQSEWAQLSIADMYLTGDGVQQSYEIALEYALLSAEQGNSHAHNMLGDIYRDGLGVEQSFEKAAEYYKMSADQGNEWGQCNLGSLYRWGDGVEQDYSKAVQLFQLAADQGNESGQFNLGELYEEGLGVAQSYESAAHYYRQSAEQGFSMAQNNLGWLYEHGLGVEQSYETAAAYYRKSADQGDPRGQYLLGLLYYNGTGVRQSLITARKYFQLSADQGFELAIDKLNEIN